MKYMDPFNSRFNAVDLKLEPEGDLITRHLSDMDSMYYDREAADELLEEDPLIYRYYNVEVPEEKGHLAHCVSMVFPGDVGGEYFMTKGHFHEVEDTAEIYYTIQGRGKMLMQTQPPESRVETVDMRPGNISYVPPYWAHRTINTGVQPLVFLAVYPGEAGHDYGIIEEKGFKKILVEEDGEPVLQDNPEYTE